jgi:hypothetical protein
MKQQIIWAIQGDGSGMEHLWLEQRTNEIIADGTVILVENDLPQRIRYTIRCDLNWAARQVFVQVESTTEAKLRLNADGTGNWTRKPGRLLASLDGCIDVDIAATPFTNTLPIRRLALQPGQSAEIKVAYITIPELSFRMERQRYTCLERFPEGGRYRYEGLSSGFTAELTVDTDGLVIDYAEIWRRLWPHL